MANEIKYVDLKTVAKIIRAELKVAFKDVKFSVRCETYSMGHHINVRYYDGPPASAVEAITDQFYGTGFDGMTDSTTYHNSEYKGETVKFAGSRPSVSRGVTGLTDMMDRIRVAYVAAAAITGREYDSDNEWLILAGMDLRWETVNRAVAKFVSPCYVNR